MIGCFRVAPNSGPTLKSLPAPWFSFGLDLGNTLAKSQILGGVHASVPRSTIITQGRQAITESRRRYWVHDFSKSVTHKQKHRNRRISTQNVKNVLKFTPINVSLPGNAWAPVRNGFTLVSLYSTEITCHRSWFLEYKLTWLNSVSHRRPWWIPYFLSVTEKIEKRPCWYSLF